MKKLLLIFITLFYAPHIYAVTTTACTIQGEKPCGIELGESPTKLSCQDPICANCVGQTIENNTSQHYQTITQKRWTRDCDTIYIWCECKTTVTYKCSNGYYGTVTGSNVIGTTPTSIDCRDCPNNATCDGGTTFKCYSNTLRTLNSCNPCPENATCNGGTEFTCATNTLKTSNSCNPCPDYALCNGTTTFTCPSTFTKDTTKKACVCNGYVSGTGATAKCTICPENATCTDGIIACNKNFYLSGNKCVACPYNGITNENGATQVGQCHIPAGQNVYLISGTGFFDSTECNATK